jgi:endonuclease G
MSESSIDWIANEGIRISSIVRSLRKNVGGEPLVTAALDSSPPMPEGLLSSGQARIRPMDHTGGYWVETYGEGASLVVPLKFPMEVVRRALPPAATALAPVQPPAIQPQVPTVDAGLIEKVEIDHDTIYERPGYDPDFLGTGDLSVPLPGIDPNRQELVTTLSKRPKETVLKYYNYSVVMNSDRRLAFYSAVNIDGGGRLDVGRREGDRWYLDPRIDSKTQIDNDFYSRQALEESRENNPFDRGHLVRRLDATWGPDTHTAKEHGDDTFHFTNCAPQFYSFNQGKKLWLGIEDYVLTQLEEGKQRACVINGPVFDGPLSEAGRFPDPNATGVKDPVFKDVAIPKFFWKLMVTEQGGRLAATAFLLSQQDQILGIDRIHERETFERLNAAQAKVFQISLGDLSMLTKLDFRNLVDFDTKEAFGDRGPRLLEGLEDIRLVRAPSHTEMAR